MNKKFISILVVVILLMSNNMVFAWTRMTGEDDNGNVHDFYGINNYPSYFVLYSGFASDTVTAFHNACTSWNSTSVGNLVFRSTAETHNYVPASVTNWAIKGDGNKVTKGNFGNIGWVGKCDLRAKKMGVIFPRYEIIESDIHLNTYRNMGSSGNANIYDVESLLLHELGHAVGLDHEDDIVAAMNTILNVGQIRRQLYQDDINGINAIY